MRLVRILSLKIVICGSFANALPPASYKLLLVDANLTKKEVLMFKIQCVCVGALNIGSLQ